MTQKAIHFGLQIGVHTADKLQEQFYCNGFFKIAGIVVLKNEDHILKVRRCHTSRAGSNDPVGQKPSVNGV